VVSVEDVGLLWCDTMVGKCSEISIFGSLNIHMFSHQNIHKNSVKHYVIYVYICVYHFPLCFN
jgi:hypothetical protein